MQVSSSNSLLDALIANPDDVLYQSNGNNQLGTRRFYECCMPRGAVNPKDPNDLKFFDVRERAENLFLSAVRQFFPNNDSLKICSIGPGECFQELVMHALVTKIGKIAHWMLVDGGEDASFGLFTRHAKEMSPNSIVEGKRAWFSTDLLKENPPFDVDIFLMIDGPPYWEVEGNVKRYMQESSKPTFAMYVEGKPEIILTYCKGNNSPCTTLSYEPTSTPDIRPLFRLTDPGP